MSGVRSQKTGSRPARRSLGADGRATPASASRGSGHYNSAMPPRFYAPDLAGSDEPVELPVEEARHLTQVLRLGAGDTVSVFDGRGVEYLARVEQAPPGRVVVRPYRSVAPPSEPVVALTVAQALLKGRTFDDVVRDVTMVGAVAIQPLLTARTEARARDTDRWTRIAVASAKQCRRAVVPEVRAPGPFRSCSTTTGPTCGCCWSSRDRRGRPADCGCCRTVLRRPPRPSRSARKGAGAQTRWPPPLEPGSAGATGGLRVLQDRMAAGFMPVTLGRRTLRADAVVVCAVSVLQYVWGDL